MMRSGLAKRQKELLFVIETETKSHAPMQLSKIHKDGIFRVTQVNPDNDCVARLMTLGLLPGREIRLTHEAPLGDPIAINFEGCHMSLRLCDAAEIEVEAIR